MASHLKDVKRSTLTDEMRKALCEYKNEHSSSQKDLQQWVQQTFDLSVSQSTISNTLKRSSKYLSKEIKNSNVKRHKPNPELEKKTYGDANFEFNFSIGWLERFKARLEINSYRRFGESGLIVMENIEDALPQIRAKLENFDWKDIYNMDEKDILLWFVAMRMVKIKCLFGLLVSLLILDALNM
ncbi:hypothetical protein Gotur_001531 [Gossypium turneri]